VLRGGMGTGLTRGVGAPRMRDVLLLSWEPQAPRDRDRDGIADRDDACRDKPEDKDGYQDQDGCPDPTVVVRFRVEDPKSRPIGAATLSVDGKPLPSQGTGVFQADLHPGRYATAAAAVDYLPLDAAVQVPEQPEFTTTFTLQPALGLVRLRVSGPGGAAVDGGWTVDGSVGPALAAGKAEITLKPGAHKVLVTVPGFHPVEREVTLKAGEDVEVAVTVQRAVITKERIDIADSVYFELNKAVIKPESFGLLDEVAQILRDHPEILRLRIEGHTDSRGSAAANLKLSDRRAKAVKDYLVSKGIEVGRLESVGYGEGRPLDKRENEEAWAKNRRVDFFIAQRKAE
jgi:outer membrane protein OmpA-like peptidoglycan-associated protein